MLIRAGMLKNYNRWKHARGKILLPENWNGILISWILPKITIIMFTMKK